MRRPSGADEFYDEDQARTVSRNSKFEDRVPGFYCRVLNFMFRISSVEFRFSDFDFRFSIFYFPFWRGVSQPPPNKRPGPSEARKIGRRSWRGCFEAFRKAACRGAPQGGGPRVPGVLAPAGKVLWETPPRFWSRVTRRGFCWCVPERPPVPPAIPRA